MQTKFHWVLIYIFRVLFSYTLHSDSILAGPEPHLYSLPPHSCCLYDYHLDTHDSLLVTHPLHFRHLQPPLTSHYHTSHPSTPVTCIHSFGFILLKLLRKVLYTVQVRHTSYRSSGWCVLCDVATMCLFVYTVVGISSSLYWYFLYGNVYVYVCPL